MVNKVKSFEFCQNIINVLMIKVSKASEKSMNNNYHLNDDKEVNLSIKNDNTIVYEEEKFTNENVFKAQQEKVNDLYIDIESTVVNNAELENNTILAIQKNKGDVGNGKEMTKIDNDTYENAMSESNGTPENRIIESNETSSESIGTKIENKSNIFRVGAILYSNNATKMNVKETNLTSLDLEQGNTSFKQSLNFVSNISASFSSYNLEDLF